MTPTPLINLLFQYENDPRPARQAEYDYCLRRNFNNPSIKSLHNLSKPNIAIPDEFREHRKYVEHAVGHWLTYRDAFEYAALKLTGEVVALTNLDIFLDDAGTDWTAILRTHPTVVFCLARTEFDAVDGNSHADQALAQFAFATSQDVWMFRSPIQIAACDFQIGTLGCDIAIAHRIKQSGYLPVNSPGKFRIYHFDRCRGKTLHNQDEIYARERSPGEGKSVHPERDGYYMVPDIESVHSVDELMTRFNLPELHRYAIICEVLSQILHPRNPDD